MSHMLTCNWPVFMIEWVKLLSCVRLFATPWTVVYQAPQSTEFSRQEYWSGLPFPSPGDLPNRGMEPGSPELQADTLPSNHQGSPYISIKWMKLCEGLLRGPGTWHPGSIQPTCSAPPEREPRSPWPHFGHKHMQAWFAADQGLQTCTSWKWSACVFVFLRSAFRKRCAESAVFLPQVFGRCTVFASHKKIQISSSFSCSSS